MPGHELLRTRTVLLLSCIACTVWKSIPKRLDLLVYNQEALVHAPPNTRVPRTEFSSHCKDTSPIEPPKNTTLSNRYNWRPRVACLVVDSECIRVVPSRRRKIVRETKTTLPQIYRPDPLPINRSMCEPIHPLRQRPTCNEFHMQDLSKLLATSSKRGKKFGADLLGTGGWRVAWKLRQEQKRSIILKTIKWKDQSFDGLTYHRQVTDAIATEAKTPKASIINIYGFCGMSVYNEAADKSLATVLLSFNIPKSPDSPRWRASWQQRLAFAQTVAHAVADLHESNAPFPVFVHRDLKPDNFVMVENRIKLNDLNDAEILLRNTTNGSPCLFRRRRWSPYYKSPEEAGELGLTAAVDVFALGGIFFYLTTGRRPYHNVGRSDAFRILLRSGHDTIPDDFRNCDDTEQMMRLIEWTWRLDPGQRPTARQVASALDQIVSWNDERNSQDRRERLRRKLSF